MTFSVHLDGEEIDMCCFFYKKVKSQLHDVFLKEGSAGFVPYTD
jgi:hypothetical protein